MTEILEAALQYRKQRLSIFPCNPHSGTDKIGNKAPLIPTFKPYRDKIATEKEITDWWTKWPEALIAIITGEPNNLTVIDADSEEAYQALQKYLPDSYITRIAKTPNGYHLYFKYFKEAINRARIMESIIKGVDIRTKGGYIIAPPSVNLENGNRAKYTWFVTAKVNEVPQALKDIIINSLYIENGVSPKSQIVTPGTSSHNKIEKGQRDDSLFHLANSLVKANMPVEEIQKYLTLTGLYCCNPPFPKKEINTKIQSALDRTKNQEKNIAYEVREWVLAVGGHFTAQDSHKEIHLVTKAHKHAANMELARMEKTGIIERYGSKRGQYRLIESACEFENYQDADAEKVDLKLPLGIEELSEVMPGELVIFAGVTNLGKTTFLLDVVRRNMGKHKIYYFSSEINKYGLNKRLKKDPYIYISDWNFKFSTKFENIIDVVQPEGITILDYIEEKDGEYYKIPSMINKIHEKLDGGICIAALQKHPFKEHGAGGYATMNKPSIYCLLDYNKIDRCSVLKIVKGKNWTVEGKNPDGYKRDFKIINGIQILVESIWYLEEKEV